MLDTDNTDNTDNTDTPDVSADTTSAPAPRKRTPRKAVAKAVGNYAARAAASSNGDR